MGIVWVRGPMSLGVPENPTEVGLNPAFFTWNEWNPTLQSFQSGPRIIKPWAPSNFSFALWFYMYNKNTEESVESREWTLEFVPQFDNAIWIVFRFSRFPYHFTGSKGSTWCHCSPSLSFPPFPDVPANAWCLQGNKWRCNWGSKGDKWYNWSFEIKNLPRFLGNYSKIESNLVL